VGNEVGKQSGGKGGKGSGDVGVKLWWGHHAKKAMVWLIKKWDVPSQNIKIHKFGCQSVLQTTTYLLLCLFWVNTPMVEHLMSKWSLKCKGMLLSFWCLKKLCPSYGHNHYILNCQKQSKYE
jgi:hypothetical protein